MNSSEDIINPIPLTQVRIDDKFWAPKIEINHKITIPSVFQQCENTGRIDNFLRAAGKLNDGKRPIFPFDDSDVYKSIEGAAYSLILNPDPTLEKYIDIVIDKIAAAQEDDGYLYTSRTISPDKRHIWAGKKRWELVSIFSHELYNLGHLIESGIAYYLATNKTSLLDVAIKSADLIEKDFGYGKIERFPGHEEIELALIKLFKITGIERYLKLAKFFIDIRGSKEISEYEKYLAKFETNFPFPMAKSLQYNQSHKKVIEQEEAVGHAVRAMYLYSAITNIAMLLNDMNYKLAVDRLWENIISKKLYVTGGVGARKFAYGEGFWDNYKLPNSDSYTETCAAIGNIFYNYRLFLLYDDAKYIDILERTLYNGFLVGVSLDGKSFFYSNQLSSKKNHGRKTWYKIPCCPTNIIRFIPQIPSYIYAIKRNILYINLFIGSRVTVSLENMDLSITQETNYPWDGNIKFTIGVPQEKNFTIAVRIPGWAQNQPLPSDLYHYMKSNHLKVNLKINNKMVNYQIEKGFVRIQRTWKHNDTIELNIPMPIRRVLSNPLVEENIKKVALERGPIVYCIESVDNEIDSIFNIKLKDDAILEEKYLNELLNGIVAITSSIYNKDGNLKKIHFIPYYAWANRGQSQMTVWIDRDSASSK